MSVRVFAWRIQFVMMMRVFDGSHPKTLCCQCVDQVDNQSRFALILTTDYVNSSHACDYVVRGRNYCGRLLLNHDLYDAVIVLDCFAGRRLSRFRRIGQPCRVA